MGELDKYELTFRCPGCGKEFKQKVAGLKGDVHCPNCGVGFKSDQAARVVDGAQKSIDKLKATIKGFNKGR